MIHTCLGLRLVPLSLGHVFLLAEVESPFLLGGAARLVDLSNAVLVCSQPWRDSADAARRWWFPFFLKLWAWRCRKLDMSAEHARFVAYMDEHTHFPIAKSSGHAEFGSVWWLRMQALLMSELHFSEDGALDMPVLKSAHLLAAKFEAEGRVKLWTQADDDFEKFCQEMDASEPQFPPSLN